MKGNIYKFEEWLSEKVEYHNELSQKIWDNTILKAKVRETLLAVGNDFWDSLDLKVPVLDVQLTGSLANYNWTSSSDLDVHIIIDFSTVDKNIELVRKALDGQRFIWNQRHNVVIEGYDVECYVQHKDEQHISSGLYSILQDKWLVTPSWNPPQVDEKDVNEKIRVIKSELREIKKKIKAATGDRAKELFDYLERFKKKILADRRSGLAQNGEFSVENLVFKELRRDGTIEDLINTLSLAYSKIYSTNK